MHINLDTLEVLDCTIKNTKVHVIRVVYNFIKVGNFFGRKTTFRQVIRYEMRSRNWKRCEFVA